jgi:protein O-mannosyl-transferase
VVPRITQALYVCGYYAWKPLAPFGLSAVYPTLHAFNPSDARFLLSAVFVIAMTTTAIVLRRRWPAVLILWACHIVLLLPVLGLSEYPHSPSDRYSYLHGALWAVALGFVLQQLWARERRGQIASLTVAFASLCFGLLAWREVPVWRSTLSLYENIVQKFKDHPSRARFDEVLGVYYLQAGRTNEAIQSLEAATYFEVRRQDRKLYEEKVLSRSNVRLAEIFLAQGKGDEAIEHYRAAAQADPSSASILLRLSACLTKAARAGEALPALAEALRLDPENPAVHHQLGVTLQTLGQSAQAERHFADERRLLAEK